MILTEPPSRGFANTELQSLRTPQLARFLKRAQRAVGLGGEVNLLLAGDDRMQALNRGFRKKNKATDVLSFPAAENPEGLAGDLAISVETAARQAADHGHSLDEELRILILHGVLHLAGMNHEADGGEMRERETQLRQALKLPVGLIERAQPRPSRRTLKSLPAGAADLP